MRYGITPPVFWPVRFWPLGSETLAKGLGRVAARIFGANVSGTIKGSAISGVSKAATITGVDG